MTEQDHKDDCHRGGCLCGAIRFRADGPPHHVSYCHCEQCRHHSGAPFAVFATYAAAAVHFEKGALRWFRSSDIAQRGFCAACGTPMAWRGNAHPDWLDIGVGTFDDARGFTLQDHVWAGSALPWITIDDHLPRYMRDRSSARLTES